MKKLYISPTTTEHSLEIHAVMDNLSYGGEKGGNWDAGAKDEIDLDGLDLFDLEKAREVLDDFYL